MQQRRGCNGRQWRHGWVASVLNQSIVAPRLADIDAKRILRPIVTQAKKAGCFSLQYSPNSHLIHTQCSSNAHLVQGHIFRNFLAIHT